MKQRAVAIVADYLSQRPLGRVSALKRVGDDDYVLGIEDVRDGRVQLVRTPGDLKTWLGSFTTGECVKPLLGLCWRCESIHADHDEGGEVFGTCIACQADVVAAAFEEAGR